MPHRTRADRLLVSRGLFDSRARAQAAIAAGLVTADGAAVVKPSDMIAANAVLTAAPAHPYVSRGGLKLAAALDHFGIDPRGRRCLDVGASTGGFTDVLLGRGARHVIAVDTGRDQLHPRFRAHRDVSMFEATDIRAFAVPGDAPDLAAIDVSFISLKLVLPAVSALLTPRADMVALIKPQFEAGRAHLKKGVVRDAAVHEAVCRAMEEAVVGLGWESRGVIPSPIEGGDGNREFLIAARRSG